ncbi:MAG: AAA family ATPase, partial [Verrucomicrobiia bacterium]
VGKSRAAVYLAVAGATGASWFGLKVHARFKTLVIQNENGRFRLSKEFADLDCEALDGFVRVCEPPAYGLAFDRAEFCAAVSLTIAEFQPDVIVIDPWNAVARDDRAKDYLETFNAIRAVIPTGDNAPALVIVAHTRKPKSEEKYRGRDLLHVLAGSYVLGSVPRTVFVMLHASDDPLGNEIVWVCCKNNDGELGDRSAWARRNGLFVHVKDFDWEAYDKPADDRKTITEADIAEVFHHGKRSLSRKQAVAALEELTGCKTSACYKALNPTGKFSKHLSEEGGLLTWTP